METRESLEVHHPFSQEEDVLQSAVNAIMHCLPLLREDDVVLLDGVLDHVGHCQDILPVLLSICFNLTNLHLMGSPLYFGIVHLKEIELVGCQEAYSLFSYLGFKLHYPR